MNGTVQESKEGLSVNKKLCFLLTDKPLFFIYFACEGLLVKKNFDFVTP